MNDLGREVLVKAALDGVKQIKHKLRDAEGGMCAGGVLWQALQEREGFTWIPFYGDADSLVPDCFEEERTIRQCLEAYGMNDVEWFTMVQMNNSDTDFLTIARKLGVEQEG